MASHSIVRLAQRKLIIGTKKWTTRNHHIKITELLLSKEGASDVQNLAGRTPLHIAAISLNSEMIHLLVESGVVPTFRTMKAILPCTSLHTKLMWIFSASCCTPKYATQILRITMVTHQCILLLQMVILTCVN